MLSYAEQVRSVATDPSPFYEAVRAAVGGEEEGHAEELFGPAEGLHATYRKLREEVLEASWRAGRELLGAAARHRRSTSTARSPATWSC